MEAAKFASTPVAAPAAPQVDPGKYNLTGKQVKEIEAQTRLLKLEKEAQRAREELAKLRKNEYRG